MPLNWRRHNQCLVRALDAAYEADVTSELSLENLQVECALSEEMMRRAVDGLLADGYIEERFAGIQFTPLGKRSFDDAYDDRRNRRIRSRILGLLAARYERKSDSMIDSDLIAQRLQLSPNSIYLNLLILQLEAHVRLEDFAGAGHAACFVTLTAAGKSFHDNPPDETIFLSHAVVDREIALFLKSAIETRFPELRVFVSSAPENQMPGGKWLEDILDAINSASAAIVLATGHALERRWIWFEAGAAWGRKISPITCCLGAQEKGNLPTPFSFLTALNIDHPNDYCALMNAIRPAGRDAISATDLNTETDVKQIVQLCRDAEAKTRAERDPLYAERKRKIDEDFSMLLPVQKRALKLLALRGEMTDATAIAQLHGEGLVADVHANVLFQFIEAQTGFVIPAPSHLDGGISNGWRINPEIQTLLIEKLVAD